MQLFSSSPVFHFYRQRKPIPVVLYSNKHWLARYWLMHFAQLHDDIKLYIQVGIEYLNKERRNRAVCLWCGEISSKDVLCVEDRETSECHLQSFTNWLVRRCTHSSCCCCCQMLSWRWVHHSLLVGTFFSHTVHQHFCISGASEISNQFEGTNEEQRIFNFTPWFHLGTINYAPFHLQQLHLGITLFPFVWNTVNWTKCN